MSLSFKDYINIYKNNDIVEVSVKPKFTDQISIRSVRRSISDMGWVKYSSRLTSYIYSTIPIRDIEKLRKNPLISEVNVITPYEFHNISPAPAAAAVSTLNSEAADSTKVNQLWAEGLTGKNVRIAVIDSGIDLNHPMFTDPNGVSKIIKYKSFTQEPIDDILGHGTFVASCAAGYPWVTGVGTLYGASPDAKLIIAKVAQGGGIDPAAISAAIDWIFSPEAIGGAGGADIVQMSIGGNLTNDKIQMMQSVVNGGAIPVCSIGNSGPGLGTSSYPGGLALAVGVGSNALKTPNYNEAATFSSRGPGQNMCIKPDFLVPGGNKFINSRLEGMIGGDENIVGAVPYSIDARGYKEWRGTSFSSPIVSGIIACLKERHDFYNLYGTVKNNNSGFGPMDSILLNSILTMKTNRSVVATKTLNIKNYDPFIALGTNPNPYYINNKPYIYYVSADFRPTQCFLKIYDNNTGTYVDYGAVLGASTPPGIIYLNNKYVAFYITMLQDGSATQLYYAESNDGIIWTNFTFITNIIESDGTPDYVTGIDALYINGKIIIYYDSIDPYTPALGKFANIRYIEYDINTNTIISTGISVEVFKLNEPYIDSYLISSYKKPRCYIDQATGKTIMMLSGPFSLNPWYIIRAESTDSITFTITDIIIPPYNKDYYKNGYCNGTLFDNKYYFSDGTFIDSIFGGTPKIYVV